MVYTQDWHPPSTPHFAKDGGTWPVHCVRDTWGAELHPGLDAAGGLEPSATLRKLVRTGTGDEDGYSAFEGGAEAATPSRLQRLLREPGIERLVVLGLATDYCVRATALEGLARLPHHRARSRRARRRPGAGDCDRRARRDAARGAVVE